MINEFRDDKPTTITVDYRAFNEGTTEIYSPLEKEFLDITLKEIAVEELYKPKKKGKVCVDLGANIGLASLYLKNWFDEVHAVEPVPLYYNALVKNTKQYGVKTYPYAISAYNRQSAFVSPRGIVPQSFYGLQQNERGLKTNNTLSVNAITIEKFMDDNDIETIDFLKMDVEGSEYEIFFDESFARVAHRIKYIIGESHVRKDGGGHPSSIPYILEDRGFKAGWKKLPENNYWYMPQFTNTDTGVSKSVFVPMWTIFEAERL